MLANAGPLLERADEIRLVTGALASVAATGTGQVVMFEGLPGIGKTRLLAEARSAGLELGFLVGAASGVDIQQDYAWVVVRQVFEHLVSADDVSAAAALGRELVAGSPLDAENARHAEYALIHSLYWLAADLAERRCLLIMVDDMQWADIASLRFLTYLAGRLDGIPVLLVCTQRPGEHRVSHVVSALSERPGVLTHSLRPLSVSAVTELLSETLGSVPDTHIAERCVDLTGGNPLLLRELMRELAHTTKRGIEEVLASGIPGIDRYVRRQIGRLTVPARRALHALAVLGDSASIDRVAAVADTPPPSNPGSVFGKGPLIGQA